MKICESGVRNVALPPPLFVLLWKTSSRRLAIVSDKSLGLLDQAYPSDVGQFSPSERQVSALSGSLNVSAIVFGPAGQYASLNRHVAAILLPTLKVFLRRPNLFRQRLSINGHVGAVLLPTFTGRLAKFGPTTQFVSMNGSVAARHLGTFDVFL